MSGIFETLAKPKNLFPLLIVINVMQYVDRGIIPGATDQFDSFIEDSLDVTSPDIYLGLLQSSFIIGFAIASILFGHLVHYYPPFHLCGIGLSIWLLAVCLSGLSFYIKSYPFLVFARMLSGVGEGSFQCSIPPWITIFATNKATWIAIFYTAIPVGTAIGYGYSSIMAKYVGWQWAFFCEAILMAPLIYTMFSVSPVYPVSSIIKQQHTDNEVNKPPTMIEELKAVVYCPVYVMLVCGYAAQCFSLIGLSTFGSKFLMNLNYFKSETEASVTFGIIVCLAGIIGTPLGGVILDKITVYKRHHNAAINNKSVLFGSFSGKSAHGAYEPLVNGGDDEADNAQLVTGYKGMRYISETDLEVLHSDTQIMTIASFIGFTCLTIVYFTHSKVFFLLIVFTGMLFIFLATSGINLGIMLSVPVQNRSFAIALSSVLIHLFGDVPSPIIAGYLLDDLAPHCSGTTDDDTECKKDADGIRLTILLISLWLVWTVIFFALGNYLVTFDIKKRRRSILDDLLKSIDTPSEDGIKVAESVAAKDNNVKTVYL